MEGAAGGDIRELDSFAGRVKYIRDFGRACGGLARVNGEAATDIVSELMYRFLRIEAANPKLRSGPFYPKD